MNLLNYRKEIFSSSMGEDGITNYIFSIIGDRKKICVDVGAWNGIFLSNTRNLIVNHGWSSLQIECQEERYNQILENYIGYPVKSVCCYVNEGNNLLDNIIEKNGLSEVNFLSIDIDGADYNVFESLDVFLPDVICIEVSSGFDPSFQEVLSIERATELSGQSLATMTNLDNSKGYQLVSFTGNAFYVKNEFFPLLKIENNSVESIYQSFIDVLAPDHKNYLKEQCYRFHIPNRNLDVIF